MLTSAVVVAGVAGGAAGCTTSVGVQSCSSSLSASSFAGSSLSAARAGQQAASGSVVTLPTGDQVQVGASGATPVLVKGRGTGGSPGFADFTWGGDQYVIPYEAVPYLGSLLDPRLFDVSYLARLGAGAAARLPVQVTYASAAAEPALPGVQVTRRSGSTATAVISRAQAPQLTRELENRWQASSAGHSSAQAGGIPGVSQISLAPPAGAPPLPAWPLQAPAAGGQSGSGSAGPAYHTLTLSFTGANGQPATAIGWVQNLASAPLGLTAVSAAGFNPYENTPPFTGAAGPLNLSLPDGTYSIQFAVFTPDPASGSRYGVDTALVVKPQVTIDSDTTVNLDARTAVPYHADISGVSPSPQPLNAQMNFTRASVTGGGCTNGYDTGTFVGGFSLLGSSTVSATSVPPVTEGSLGFDAETEFTTSGAAPAMYLLAFPHSGSIPASLSYTVPQADMTTVHEQVYYPSTAPADCNGPGYAPLLLSRADFPWGTSFPLHVGSESFTPQGDNTVYWFTSDTKLTAWQDDYSICTIAEDSPGQVWTAIKPGQQITQTWGKYPYAPEPRDNLGYASGNPVTAICPACRQDDNFEPAMWPASATDFGTSRSWSFYRNGSLVQTEPYSAGNIDPFGEGASLGLDDVDLPLSPQPATYQLDWAIMHRIPDTGSVGIDPNLYTETDWTFRSGPGDPPATLPAGEGCAPDPSRSCQFLPLLFIDYDLPLDYSEQATAGQPFTIDFTVAHQPGEAPPAGVKATVAASFDDGQTWGAPHDATSLGGDRFAVTIDQPPLASTSGYASLQVTAADSAGNAVTQTAIEAYHLTS